MAASSPHLSADPHLKTSGISALHLGAELSVSGTRRHARYVLPGLASQRMVRNDLPWRYRFRLQAGKAPDQATPAPFTRTPSERCTFVRSRQSLEHHRFTTWGATGATRNTDGTTNRGGCATNEDQRRAEDLDYCRA